MSNKLNGADLLNEEDCERILYRVLYNDSIEKTPEVKKVLITAYNALKAQNNLYKQYGRFNGVASKMVDSSGNNVEYRLRFVKPIQKEESK